MINFALNYISPIFYKVLYMSIIGIFVGIFILVIRKILDKRISPKWKCFIWLLLMISLIVPVKIEVKNNYVNTKIISISGLVEPIQNISSSTELNKSANLQKEYEEQEKVTTEVLTESQSNVKDNIKLKDLILNIIIPILWFAGIFLNSLLLILGNNNIKKNIKGKVYKDKSLDNLIEECKNAIRVKSKVEVILQDFKQTPSIIGIFKPQILITKEFLLQDDTTKRYIIMHELSHYKRKDLIFNYIVLFITIIHWFNPFVWLFFKRIRQDIELATDEMVLDKLNKDEIKEYGTTLINSLKIFQEEKYTAKLLCVTDDSKNMERRIKMVKLSEKFKNNKLLIAIISIIIIIVGMLLFFTHISNNNDETSKKYETNSNVVFYDKEGNIIYDSSRANEVTEIIRNTVIQGKVELNHNGNIYIFNGQHFGEFGLEMEEYTRTVIKDNNQTCIDYMTLEKYNTSYIEEGDLLICSGDLSKKGYSMGDNDFDSKNNAIIVLKSNDYNKMMQDALKGNRVYPSIITIADAYIESGYVYLKYTLEDDTHSDTGYNFPFAVKAYITDNTKITGDFKIGNTVKIKYENEDIENLKIESIEIFTQNSEKISKKYEYKAFKPSFKKTSESTYDDYDFTQDMIYKDNIYYKKINNYEEYSKVKSRWNNILDMNKEDFKNAFMVITAIENTSMIGLTIDKIDTDDKGLYISLIHYEDGANFDENETCISIKISRDLEKENIYVTRNLRDNEKDMSVEMQLAEKDVASENLSSFQYKDESYRKAEKSSSSVLKLVPPDWKDKISKNFTITNNMPQIDFSNWNNLGNDFYSIAITDYSEYLKLMNNYNAPKMTWFDFKYIYAIIVVRANSDNTIAINNIENENGKSYLNISPGGWLNVTEEFKYPAVCIAVPNYRSLESNFLNVRVK